MVARTGSTRVPGKALLEVGGRTVVENVLRAAKKIQGIDQVALATSTLPQDQKLGEIAARLDIKTYFGDPERVLDRVWGAIEMFGADVIVEIGGDCPLLDPSVISRALVQFKAEKLDYLSNYDPPTFPEGLDVNIVSVAAVKRAYAEAIAPSQRIHPFSFLTHHPELFKLGNFVNDQDLSEMHWSLDFPEDIEFIRYVYEKLEPGESAISMKSVLALIASDARAHTLNEKIRKPKSLHAFWNSPGIIRDMHEDLRALSKIGESASAEKNLNKAAHAYSEIARISKYLEKMASTQQKEIQ